LRGQQDFCHEAAAYQRLADVRCGSTVLRPRSGFCVDNDAPIVIPSGDIFFRFRTRTSLNDSLDNRHSASTCRTSAPP
jgi:hypothetical protein